MSEGMAANVNITSRFVQELMEKGEELPGNYVYKDGLGGLPDTSVPLVDLPVIDLGLLTLSTEEELEKLRAALITWGCFQVINHGMTSSFLDHLRELTKQFFSLPVEEKKKYLREAGQLEGYGNDMILSETQILDWTDRLYLLISPEDQRKLKFWPENPKSFRVTLNEYGKNLEFITETVLKAMARSLKLNDNCFLEQYGESATIFARFNFYPPCPRPDVLGLKPHADGSAITVVLPDKEVAGLQFLKDDRWIRFPIIPDALLINVGDQIEIMSNGIFKSPVHRVVPNSESERISVAVFCAPRSDREIEPVDELINEARPRMYKKIKDYGALFFRYYQQGERPIDAVKI